MPYFGAMEESPEDVILTGSYADQPSDVGIRRTNGQPVWERTA